MLLVMLHDVIQLHALGSQELNVKNIIITISLQIV